MSRATKTSWRRERDHSFERLYRRHRSEVFRHVLRSVGNREDAEDVTQTAFLDAYRAMLRGGNPARPRAWLLAIAENARRTRFRSQQRRPEQLGLDDDAVPVAVPASDAHELREALDQLPQGQRSVFVLRELAGLSYGEIAARLGLTVGSVQMLLFRARRALREQLSPDTARRRLASVVGFPLPQWLLNALSCLSSSADRAAAAARAGGAGALVVGAALATGTGIVVVPGAQEQRDAPARTEVTTATPPRLGVLEGARKGVRPPLGRAAREEPPPAATARRTEASEAAEARSRTVEPATAAPNEEIPSERPDDAAPAPPPPTRPRVVHAPPRVVTPLTEVPALPLPEPDDVVPELPETPPLPELPALPVPR